MIIPTPKELWRSNFLAFPKIYLGTFWYNYHVHVINHVPMATRLWYRLKNNKKHWKIGIWRHCDVIIGRGKSKLGGELLCTEMIIGCKFHDPSIGSRDTEGGVRGTPPPPTQSQIDQKSPVWIGLNLKQISKIYLNLKQISIKTYLILIDTSSFCCLTFLSI